MNCWAVQKLLPLYVGESDLPIGSKTIKRHLKNCSACNQIYQEYLIPKKVLKELKNPDLPVDFFASSWDKIYSEISQPQEFAEPKTRLQPIEWKLLWQPAFAIVLLSLSIVMLYGNFSIQEPSFSISPVANTSSFFNKEKASPSFNSTWEAKSETLPVVLNNFVEYHLEQVKPLETQDASF